MMNIQCHMELARQFKRLRPEFPGRGDRFHNTGLSLISHRSSLHKEIREIDLFYSQLRHAFPKRVEEFILKFLLTFRGQ